MLSSAPFLSYPILPNPSLSPTMSLTMSRRLIQTANRNGMYDIVCWTDRTNHFSTLLQCGCSLIPLPAVRMKIQHAISSSTKIRKFFVKDLLAKRSGHTPLFLWWPRNVDCLKNITRQLSTSRKHSRTVPTWLEVFPRRRLVRHILVFPYLGPLKRCVKRVFLLLIFD